MDINNIVQPVLDSTLINPELTNQVNEPIEPVINNNILNFRICIFQYYKFKQQKSIALQCFFSGADGRNRTGTVYSTAGF